MRSDHTVHPYYIEMSNGRLGPAESLEVALRAAHEAESSGWNIHATRIVQGRQTILEGAELRKRLDEM